MSSRAEDDAAAEQPPTEPAEQRAETLRRELDVLLGELRSRGKRAFDVRYQLQQHPAVVAGAGALMLAGVGLIAVQIIRRQRRKHSVRARLAALSDLIQERAAAGISAARTGVAGTRRRRPQQAQDGFSPLLKAAIGIALPRLLPLVIGKLLKGAEGTRRRPPLAVAKGGVEPTG